MKYDILGKTLTSGAKSMGWDELNRMLSFNPGPGGQATLYLYRADGMRVRKGLMASPNVYTEYAYDGQMPVEEYNYRSVYPISFIKVIRYGLGARGVDYIEKVPANGPLIVGYPIYDDHGNMIATLGKNGVLADQRSYDAWGVIRAGNTTGEPHGQYCANLGHLADDESGLIYMRARYYDAGSGRFVSEDPASNGMNWFAYCGNRPVSRADRSGKVFMDMLCASLDSLKESVADGSFASEFKAWGSNKIDELVAYEMGVLIGACVAAELTDGGVSLDRMFITGARDGFGFRWNDADVYLHDADHGFGPHVDLRGALGKYESWFKEQFGSRGIPLDAFARGFYDGFF